MSIRKHIALALCYLQSLLGFAQAVQGDVIALQRESDSVLVVRFTPRTEPSLVEGALRWEGLAGGLGAVGAPDLPIFSTLITLPRGSSLTLKSVEGDEAISPHAVPTEATLPPVPAPWIKDRPQPQPQPDKSIYASDTAYRGGPIADVEDLGALGRWQYFRLTIRPLAYHPSTGDLWHYQRLTLTLSILSSPTLPPLEGTPSRYLIVSRPRFREGLQPFVQWKRQEGYDVVECYADTNQRDSVRALLAPFFLEASPLEPVPEYVLLVGDAAQLQSFVSTNHPSGMDHHLTDQPYVNHNGALLPAAHIGRWPVNDTAELGTVLRKTLAYEQGQSLDTAALRRVLLVAGRETTAPAPTTTNGQVNYLKRELTLANPTLDTFCHYNPDSQSQAALIASEIKQGIGLLNYTAHCTVGGWTSPAVNLTTLDTLPAHMPLLYVNNCCKSNDFGGTGFGEQLLRMPAGGAIGVIGATNNTLWNEDYYWAVGPKLPVSLDPVYQAGLDGAFDRWVGRTQNIETQGELLAAGNLAVTAFGSLYSSFYWQTYCLFGDPALKPYLGVPTQAVVSLAGEPRNGQSALHLSGTPLSTVTAIQDTLLLGVTRLDSSGAATLPLRRQLDTVPLILTASGRGLIPTVDTLEVASGASHAVALRNAVAEDSTVRFTVENIGTHRIDSLLVTLTQTASDSLAGVHIATQSLLIDSLMPGANQALALPVQITSFGVNPILSARITAHAEGIFSDIAVRSALPDERPTVTLQLVREDGTVARRLMPATNYMLKAEVAGQYDSIRLTAFDHISDSLILDFITPSPLCALPVSATLYRGSWTHTVNHWLVPGERIESFEDGFASFPWDTACRIPWTIDSAVSHTGEHSARSGAIGHEQTSDLVLDIVLPYDDTLSYWVKISSEPQYDQLVFSVDGERMQPTLWGELNWRQYKYRLTAGHHTLRWRYQKDQSTSQGNDCVWIDDISLPMIYWDMPVGWECMDTTVSIELAESIASSLVAYPNPAMGMITLRAAEAMQVEVVDAVGRVVLQLDLLPNTPHHVETSHLPSGIYYAIGRGCDKMSHTKIIKMNN